MSESMVGNMLIEVHLLYSQVEYKQEFWALCRILSFHLKDHPSYRKKDLTRLLSKSEAQNHNHN